MRFRVSENWMVCKGEKEVEEHEELTGHFIQSLLPDIHEYQNPQPWTSRTWNCKSVEFIETAYSYRCDQFTAANQPLDSAFATSQLLLHSLKLGLPSLSPCIFHIANGRENNTIPSLTSPPCALNLVQQ